MVALAHPLGMGDAQSAARDPAVGTRGCSLPATAASPMGAAGARLHLQRGLPRFALHLCLSHGTEALQYSCAAETALTWKKENLPVRARYSEIAHLGLLKPKFE